MRFRVRQRSFVRACSWGSSPNRLDCESLRNPSRRSIIAHLSFFENKNVSAPEERVIFEQGTISTSVTHTFRGGINHEKIFFDDRCRGTRSCLSAQEQRLPHKIDVAAAIDGQTRREVIFAARSARPPYGPHPSGGRTQESLLREAFFACSCCGRPLRRAVPHPARALSAVCRLPSNEPSDRYLPIFCIFWQTNESCYSYSPE